MASSVARMATAADDWRGHGRVGGAAATFSGARHGGQNSFAPANLKDAIVRQQQRGDVPSTSSSSSASFARKGKAAVNEEDDRVSSATEQQRQSQILDRWAAHHAREMVTTIERQVQHAEISKLPTNSQPVCVRAASLLREASPPTNSNSSTGSTPAATGGNARPNVRASSLIQMWRELEAEAGISPPKQRTVSGFTNGESSAGNSFSINEPSSGNSDYECYAFAEWSSDAITTTANSASSSMNENEKSRVGSIVKKLISDHGGPRGFMATALTNENDATPCPVPLERWRGTTKAALGLRPLRGRGEMERFVARIEQERQRELVAVAARQHVSRFANRGRIQSMLKLRSLRRQEAVQDQMQGPPPLPRSQRQKGSAISSIRERFDRGHHSSSSRNLTLDTSANIQDRFPINNEVSNFLMNPKREELYACSTNHFAIDTTRYQEIAPPLPCPANHLISDTAQYQQSASLLSCHSDHLTSNSSAPQFQQIAPLLPCPTDHLTSNTSSPRYRQIRPPLPCPTNQLTSNTSPRYRQIVPPLPYPIDHFTSNTSSPQFRHIAPPLPCVTGDLTSNTSPRYRQIAHPLPCPTDHLTSNTSPRYRQIAPPLPCPTDHLTSNTSPRYQHIAHPFSCLTDHFTSNTPQYRDIVPPLPSSINHSTSNSSQCREITPPHPCPTEHLTFNISQYQEITPLLPHPTDHCTFNTSRYQEIVPPLPRCNDTPQYQEIAAPKAPVHTQSELNLPHPTITIEDLHEGSQITTIDGSWNESNMWVGNLESIPSNEWQNEVIVEEMESFPQQNMSMWVGDESSNTWRGWRVQRRPLDHDFLENFSDNVEIRELLERRRVSTSLESDFCDKMNQMLLSFLQQRENQSNNEEEENNVDFSYWQTGVEEDQNDESIPSSLVPLHNQTYQTMQQPHDWQRHEPFSHQSSQNVPDMEVMNDMRNDMAKIRGEINELRVMVESCIESQSKLRQSIKQDILEAIQQAVGTASSRNFGKGCARKGTCCICCEVQVDSLLYRCGHMCTCFNCAHQLQWSSGKCPICRSPIVDVIRAFPNT